MFKKITLTLFATVMIVALSSCSQDPTPEVQPSSSASDAQQSHEEATTETNPADNQQLLPIVSGNGVDLQLSVDADGSTHQLKVGEVMAITLESNPSTGYAWYATSSDPDVMAQMGEAQYQEPEFSPSEPMLGAAGTETLYFTAVGVGTTTLTLDYKRGWETNVAPEKTITITVELE